MTPIHRATPALCLLGACADDGGQLSALGMDCVTVIEIDAEWSVQEDGTVDYEPCYSCDDNGRCDVEECCPSPWVFVAPGDDFATVICALP